MNDVSRDIFVGYRPIHRKDCATSGRFVDYLGERYYHIANSDQMPPFFMSLVSSSDHWMFIASNGGLTAGRANSDSALFPYETEDKLMAHPNESGSHATIRVEIDGRCHLWEPFSDRYTGVYQTERHLYKNVYGNKLVFEEVNHDLKLTMRMAWFTGDRFGFVKRSWLQNNSDAERQIDLLDGFRNLLPYGATALLQNTMSNLLHAYKRNELELETGLGIFALSATLTDRAEPSESLKGTVAWQVGLTADSHLLSFDQVEQFRYGRNLTSESEVLGRAGAYLVCSSFALGAHGDKRWSMVADVNQDKAAVAELLQFLKQDKDAIGSALDADIAEGTANLVRYVASADGLQQSAQETTTVHHFANVLFNIMRGGIFTDGHRIERDDLLDFVRTRNRAVLARYGDWFSTLPETIEIGELNTLADRFGEADIVRLCHEYLPLTFSRRHGDPSRPWNQFSINLKKEDGSPNLDYQGNWRDIFQNWEPLALSFPGYVVGVIAKFLNATTADGYNPYRVTRSGIEWESPEPDNPWANIGYWSDHQIIYLQKLLEVAKLVDSDGLKGLWNQPVFAYADVPYRLRPYSDMLKDWYDTIDFDWDGEERTKEAVAQIGMDGRLHQDGNGQVVHGMMVEKMLVLLLAKLTNLVPDGGIWMNTQRPEWNDANNALVGKGLSVVTAGYLRRFIGFWNEQLAETGDEFAVNTAVVTLFNDVAATFTTYQSQLDSGFTNESRQSFMDALGTAATQYRTSIYERGLSQETTTISAAGLGDFLTISQAYIDKTLRANIRPDGLAHTYNILQLDEAGAGVGNLYLMLEGQVSLLSSGALSPDEGLALLRSLRQSDLYRENQHSYMLYPNRRLDNFQQKNNVSADQVAESRLISALVAAGDINLMVCDVAGEYHFNGRFRNADDAAAVLNQLEKQDAYRDLVAAERDFILDLFETTFNHSSFTGRSGTFFAYEGLGSIYWHMVSKLLLAAQECYQQAVDEGLETAVTDALADIYYDIRDGIGFNKSPEVYGAFPTDPYSHTPQGSGARQPGMTGQVKEEILTRWGELGVKVADGALSFSPTLLRTDEFLAEESAFRFVNMAGEMQEISLPVGSLAFTFCQTPIVYQRGNEAQIDVVFTDGRSVKSDGDTLDRETTQQIFGRDGQIKEVWVTVTI